MPSKSSSFASATGGPSPSCSGSPRSSSLYSRMTWHHRSNTAMVARYQLLTAPVRKDVADRVGRLIWVSEEVN